VFGRGMQTPIIPFPTRITSPNLTYTFSTHGTPKRGWQQPHSNVTSYSTDWHAQKLRPADPGQVWSPVATRTALNFSVWEI